MMRERFDLEPMTEEEIERRTREILASPRIVAPVAHRSQSSRKAGEVTEKELLARVEAALDRNAEAFDRNAEAFDRNIEAFERNARTIDEHNLFMREMTLRVEKVGKQMVRAIAHTAEETVREIRESRERWSAELHSDMQAQREVMFKILDKFED